MKVYEFGQEHEDIFVMFRCAVEPWWVLKDSAEEMAKDFHVYLFIADGHDELGTEFTSLEKYAADPEHAGRDAALMRKTAKQIRDNLDAIAARKIRLSPGKTQAFRLLPTPLVGWILGFVFQSSFGDRFMYRHSMRAPDEMRQLHEQFYRWLE